MSQTAAWQRLGTPLLCVLMSCLIGPLTAAADDESAPAVERHAPPGIVLGLKAGLGSGKPVNDFGLQYGFELELGYLLPLPAPVLHAVELFVSVGYVQSSLTGQSTERDARLPGDGRVSFTIREQSLPWGGGVRFRVPLHSERFAPYLAAGYRAFHTSDTVRTRVAGRAVSDSSERSLVHGFFASVGLEYFVGPGAVLAELQLARAARAELVVHDAVGGIMGFLGYRVMFGKPAPRPVKVETEPEPAVAVPTEAVPVAPAETSGAALATNDEAATTVAAEETYDSQIRGVVRSFGGQPVLAQVSVEPGALTTETDANGKFSLGVAPGRYTVTLRAQGFASQTKACVVDQAGITVLNVELRDE